MNPDTNPYSFYHIKNENIKENGHIRNRLYRFKSKKSNLWYIVLVEEYEHNVFAVKFYPKMWRLSKYKYQMLTGTNEPRRIINTCINIMISIYNENPKASFGFIGVNRKNEKPNETKRYKVYSTIIATYFNDKYFLHKENKEKSAYLLINNQALLSNPTLVKDIEDFFKNQYSYFD
ncbi:hypothetical protein D2S45_03220 [Prevotella intermedia]|uniref:Uncharacterized protein n=1 Tax=Prevotella intermedia TaxID=28131 RepID=A0A3R8HJX5_PREIN|nr:hypothetical protein D2S53_01830 [Prevotella intermedia]RRF87918.1 hypothetical protein D2S45_03220 [Prevotella intermedia]